MSLDFQDPKVQAMFKVNQAAANLAFDLKDTFQTMKTPVHNHWDHIDPEVQGAVNAVTFAIKHLIDLTNNRLEVMEK